LPDCVASCSQQTRPHRRPQGLPAPEQQRGPLPAVPPAAIGEFMRTEIDRYGAIVKLSGAKME
ncbi:hypothetical protein, partial [Streptomyces halstedii]|uniref:hypothetical protein n=1 Tax=Streptomyces halstedii TaxID=1944 RepID=UPI0036CF3141